MASFCFLRCGYRWGGLGLSTCSRLHAVRRLTTFPVSTCRIPQPFILKGRSTSFNSSIKPQRPLLVVCQAYSSSSEGDEGEGGEEKPAGEEQESVEGDGSLGLMTPIVKQYALAPMSIPDRFPEVPVLPISRHPIFPRFVKMLEVCLHSTSIFVLVHICTYHIIVPPENAHHPSNALLICFLSVNATTNLSYQPK